jgi:ArsR family transcriptional regulator, lead/cadmium/zinc/bismuth-responsive transcriptional repressor
MLAYYIALCNCEAMTRPPMPKLNPTTSPSRTSQVAAPTGCKPRAPLIERPLLAAPHARALERTFKILASETRLRLLHALVARPGMAVTELAQTVGMKAQAVSNQLQRLADKGIVSSVRDGTSIHYRVVDPCVVELIDRCWCLVEDARDRFDRLNATAPAASTSRARFAQRG